MRIRAKKSLMSNAEFSDIISKLNYSQRDIARLFGLGEVTPQRWASGENDVTNTAAIILLLIDRRPELLPLIEEIAGFEK